MNRGEPRAFRARTFAMAAALVLCAAFRGEAAVQAAVVAELRDPVLPYHRTATLLVRVACPKGSTVQWPELAGEIADVDVLADAPTVSEQPDGGTVGERVYRIDAIKPGLYRLPDVQVSVTLGDETTQTALPPMVLKARELTEEEKASASGFVESAPLSALDSPTPRRWIWAAAGGLAAVAAGLAWWWHSTRLKPQPVAPPKPAWDVALARLHELRTRNLPIQGQTERYYVDLSAIVRYYIEDRFGLRAPEQTTQEFLDVAAQSGRLTEGHQTFLAQFLRHCDRVKFARHEPGVVEMEQRLSEVEVFVRETVPAPETGAEAEDAA